MLGSTNSARQSSRKLHRTPDAGYNPKRVRGLVAWYDFKDKSTQWIERDSYTTQVTSNGNSIGRIQNKATGGARMGEFIRATNDAERPTHQGGFGRFDGSNDSLYGYGTAATTGKTHGTLSSKFSDVKLDPLNLSMFVVVNADSSSISGDGYMVCISGTATNSDSEDITIVLRHESSTNDTVYGVSYENETDQELNSGTNLPATKSLLALVCHKGEAKVYLNGTADGDAELSNSQNRILQQTSHNLHGFCIGEIITGALGQVDSGFFDGDIGEVLVYNRSVNDNERTDITSYLNSKWSIY